MTHQETIEFIFLDGGLCHGGTVDLAGLGERPAEVTVQGPRGEPVRYRATGAAEQLRALNLEVPYGRAWIYEWTAAD